MVSQGVDVEIPGSTDARRDETLPDTNLRDGVSERV
jgi:hypothetical protein